MYLNSIYKAGIVLIFASLVMLSGCSEVENDVYSKYQNTNLDIIVPELCKASFDAGLNKLSIEEQITYEYRKFFLGNYSNKDIEGYVSLEINERHSMADLHNFVIELTKECYANTEFFFSNDDNGWESFRDELNLIHSKNISVHRTQVTKDRLSIFVNMSEYDSKKK